MASRDRCCVCRCREHIGDALGASIDAADTVHGVIEVLAQRRPGSMRSWLSKNSDVVAMIRNAHTKRRPLTHSDLDALERPTIARNLRRDLIDAGLLEHRHHGLDLFDEWTERFLKGIENETDRPTLQTYIRWSQRRRLEDAIEVGTIRAGSFRVARRYIHAAARFLTATRTAVGDLAACDQHHIDSWFANGNTNALSVLNFLAWAKQQRLIDARITLPVPQQRVASGLTTDERATVIRHLLQTDEISNGDRFAGLLVTIYAQPVSRISRMRADDINIASRPPTAHFGRRSIDLDEHTATVCFSHLDERNEDSPWLFPGQTGGQPMSATGLAERLRPHGVTKEARISALHDLTRQVPSTILADLIGYNRFVVANRADALGEPWQRYAALASTSR